MTGEEYIARVNLIKDKYGKAWSEQQGSFNGYVPVLFELRNRREGINAGEIASKFHISTARVAKIINYLEEKKYVIREKDNDDKRITIVKITDSGLDFLNNFKLEKINEIGEAIKDISDNDLEIFFSVTERMLENMCNKREEKKC